MFFISLFIAAFTLEKENRVEKTWVLISGGTGWVWLLSTPLTLWFIFAALFMDGSWWEFWYSMAVCSIFGGWCKGFQRLALEKRLAESTFLNTKKAQNYLKKLLILMLLPTATILLSPTTAIAEKTMACETELAVGFAKVDGVWKPVKLDVPPFTIVISDDYKNIKMQRHEEGAQWRRKFICAPSKIREKERV